MIALVTLTLRDGRAFRAATDPLTVPTRLGTPVTEYAYDGVLVGGVEFVEQLDVFTLDAVAGLQQTQIEIMTTTAFAELADDWLHLLAAEVEIALLASTGGFYEDRRVLLSGARVQGLSINGLGEISSFVAESLPPPKAGTVGDDARDLGNEWPDPLADVAAGEMSSLVGAKHVWVVGRCYGVPAYKVGEVGGNNRLVLCGHRLADTGSITIYEDGVSAGSRTPANTTNSAGAYGYHDHATDYAASDGGYTWDATRGGVALATDPNVAVLGAAEVLRWLLVQSGAAIDWSRQEETLQRLGGWEVGLWADQETDALDLIRANLVPILPLIEVSGSGSGLWYALSDPHLRDVELRLVAGQQLVSRDGGITYSDPDAIRNRFVLEYAYDAQTREYGATATVDADNDVLCYLSAQLFGDLPDDTLRTTCTWDEATAYRILRARAARYALPRRLLAYYVADDTISAMRAGMVVTLEDEDSGLSEQRAVVVEVRHTGGTGWVRFALLERSPSSREL